MLFGSYRKASNYLRIAAGLIENRYLKESCSSYNICQSSVDINALFVDIDA